MPTRKILACAALCCGLCALAPQAAPVVLETTAAVVNNDIILTSELDALEARIRAQGAASGIAARKAALESLIARSLVMQQARQSGITPTDLQIDQALSSAAQRNNTTPQHILQQVAPGRPEAEAREIFAQELIANEVRRSQVRRRVNVSEHEVIQYAKRLKQQGSVEPSYHLAQIIVPLSPRAGAAETSAANAKVSQIKRRLAEGASFNELAALYTQGELASQGGDLGYVPETRVPLPFVPAIIKAKPGQVVGPMRSPMGMHLIKVIDITHSAVPPVTQYDASHILVKTSVVFNDEAARAKLSDLRNKIIAGALTFEEAAHQNSEDPGSAVQGGSLGFSSPDRYDPTFARVMVSLGKGEISEPFRSSFGWHIIRLNDTRVDQDSDAAYRDRARSILYERNFEEQARAWEQGLRASAYINIRDPQLLELEATQGAAAK